MPPSVSARFFQRRPAPFSRASVLAIVVFAQTNACGRRVQEPSAEATAPLRAAPEPATAAASATPPAVPLVATASVSEPALAADGGATTLRFAVIGDYGAAGSDERRVSELVKAYHPDIVITTGDNNYPFGAADTIDANIGQFYAEYIGSYHGKYGSGAAENRFFPALGNHDWYTDGARAYLEYFTLPGNERYYAFVRGPVEFFALDSDPHEPDGTTAASTQGKWLEARAKASRAAWQIAYMHHPPYSSSLHGSTVEAQWPYREWGIDLVLAGHDHTYERAVVGGVTYLVNGLGGNHEYEFKAPAPGSVLRYNEKHGAQLCEATEHELRLSFVNVDGTRIDEVVLTHDH